MATAALGDVRAPLGTAGLSSYLLLVQAMDTVKQAAGFGDRYDSTQRMAGPLVAESGPAS